MRNFVQAPVRVFIIRYLVPSTKNAPVETGAFFSIMKLVVKNPISLFSSCFVSLSIWLLFLPGILSWDSIYYFQEAVSGKFIDWHPPLPAFILYALFKLGGGLKVITFFQCVLGVFGVRQFIVSFLSLFKNKYADVTASITLILLASPLTPFSIFLVTFWKDTWFLIVLIWLGAFLCSLYAKANKNIPANLYTMTGLALVLSIEILIRHNGYFVCAGFMTILFCTIGDHVIKLREKFYILLTPLILFCAFYYFEYQVMDTQKNHIEKVVYAIDLLSMVHLDNHIENEMPYLSANLLEDFYTDFKIGDEGTVYALSGQVLDLDFYNDPSKIKVEYFDTVKKHPIVWMQVKWLMYVDFLTPRGDRYLYHDHIEPNQFGVQFDSTFVFLRNLFFAQAGFISHHWILRWLSYEHSLWLLLNILMIIYCVRRWCSPEGRLYVQIFSVLLLPLIYYLSYFWAITYSDYRFLYPSTLLMQIILLSLVFAYAIPWLVDRRTRHGEPRTHSMHEKRSVTQSVNFLN